MSGRERLLNAAVPFAVSVLAVFLACLVGGIFLEIRGKDALHAYEVLIQRGLGNPGQRTETFKQMAPLLIMAGGLAIALKAGVWNIGVDGQFFVGALLCGIIAPELAGSTSRAVVIAAGALAGLAGGLLWAVVPGILRVRWGLNEIITTLMMNYVAVNVTSWLVKGPVRDPARVAPETKQIPLDHRLPNIPGTSVHVGLLAGLLVVVLVGILFRSTVLGFMLTVLGRNRRAAIHAGMPVGRLTLLALLLSGAFAGLAGANDVLSVQGRFSGTWHPEYGFAAFALVYLARLNPLAIIPFAFFFSFLMVGGQSMPRRANVPTYYVDMLEGLMLVFFAATVAMERLWSRAARRVAEDEPAAIGAAGAAAPLTGSTASDETAMSSQAQGTALSTGETR
ncbi:MAG: ABC transporter permease [Thermomicrobiales bacterium]|nr:MAG: ABC transporter permease [Thermomicrobiales bacterium]